MRQLISLLLLSFTTIGLAEERIHNYHSDIVVDEKGDMTVTETITVNAEGNKIKRGIYRDFPTQYKDRLGNKYNVEFSVTQVLRDGSPENFHTEKNQTAYAFILVTRIVIWKKVITHMQSPIEPIDSLVFLINMMNSIGM